MLNLREITPATNLPVSLPEQKVHSRIDGNNEDGNIAQAIEAATLEFQGQTNRSLLDASWELKLNSFPSDGVIVLNGAPLSSVSSIKYYDLDGNLQTWDSGDYLVDIGSEPGRITLAPDASFPSTQTRADAIQIVYVLGYGNPDDVPVDIKRSIMALASHYLENREVTITGTIISDVPGTQATIDRYKVHKLA